MNTSNASVDQLQVETSHYIPKDPRKLTNSNEILSCLSWYQSEEAALSNSLAALLSDRASIADSLHRLEALVPHLDGLCLESSQLGEKVSSTAKTADRVGGRVRGLDQEMSRVSQAAERVGQVMELKVIQYMQCTDSFPDLHSSSPPFPNYRPVLNARTGSRRLDIVLVLCRCPLRLFLALSREPPWYGLSCDCMCTRFKSLPADCRESSPPRTNTSSCEGTTSINIPHPIRTGITIS